MATDEEVAQQKQVLASLREEVANGERESSDRDREASNDIVMANLLAEEAKLRAKLAEQESTRAQVDSDTGSNPVTQAMDDMKRAVEMQKAQEALAADPNPQAKPEADVEATDEPPVPPVPPAETSPTTTPPAPPAESGTTTARKVR